MEPVPMSAYYKTIFTEDNYGAFQCNVEPSEEGVEAFRQEVYMVLAEQRLVSHKSHAKVFVCIPGGKA